MRAAHVFWFGVILAGCGGEIATSVAEAGSGSAGGGIPGAAGRGPGGSAVGGSTVGGVSSASSGGATNLTNCPRSVPSEGDTCQGADTCFYVTSAKPCCAEGATASCREGSWRVAETDCDCPETGGTGGDLACAEPGADRTLAT